MNALRRCRPVAAAVLASLAAVGSAQAVVASGASAPTNAETIRALRASPPNANVAEDFAVLREGVITALSPDGGRVEIQGNWLKVVTGRTRFFQHGAEVTSKQLQKGSKIRFTIAPGTNNTATLGVVYVP